MTFKFCNKDEKKCDRMSECISHKVFVSATHKVNDYLDSLTLQKVLESKEFR